MGENRRSEIDSNYRNRLALRFIDGHRKTQSDWELATTERKREIEAWSTREADPRDECLLSSVMIR